MQQSSFILGSKAVKKFRIGIDCGRAIPTSIVDSERVIPTLIVNSIRVVPTSIVGSEAKANPVSKQY